MLLPHLKSGMAVLPAGQGSNVMIECLHEKNV